MRRTARLLALPVAVALVLGACGGDDPEAADAAPASSSPADGSSAAAGSPPPAAPVPAGGTVAVTSVDFSFALDRDELTAGTYEITLTNDGDSTHDLVVERDGEEVAASEAVDPGQSTTLTVDLEAGEYVFYCSIANHRAMGMEVPVEVS
ncbi:UNVERIFIED_ORG: hypothetical protein E4P37_12835 [Bacillus sp. AZ43]